MFIFQLYLSRRDNIDIRITLCLLSAEYTQDKSKSGTGLR